jgi:hypothetical protein
VFAGADLAYTRGLQYCRNTAYEPHWQHLETDEQRAEAFKGYLAEKPHSLQPDVHGQPTITTREFMQFRDWIVARAAAARQCAVLNATGGGILHGGVIAQTSFGDLPLRESRDMERVAATLTAAWRQSIPAPAASERLAAALTDTAALPLGDWLDFGGDTATAEQMLAAATRAADRLNSLARAVPR